MGLPKAQNKVVKMDLSLVGNLVVKMVALLVVKMVEELVAMKA